MLVRFDHESCGWSVSEHRIELKGLRLIVRDIRHSDNILFEYSETGRAMLHKSPPVIHPSLPLVAWPVTPERLLLATWGQDSRVILYPLEQAIKRSKCISPI